ncbi:MAG: hypothetical protein PUK05_04060, partial [Peptoniphilaceae bacterium]|nr:hypothetical protein [Peptoniphilaceae bacterium]MDY5766613.1 hypothetical protein [Peptoniphilaceae bacterium]
KNLQTAPGTGPEGTAPGAVYLIYLFFEYTDLAGSFRPLKRSIGEAKNKGLGSSQQAKISAPAAGRKRRFCGSVATLPMLALL